MDLPVQVTFRNMEPHGLEDVINEQAAKLDRYYDRITSCRVAVEMQGHHQEGNFYHVRIDLGLPGKELVVNHEPRIHGTLREEAPERMSKSKEADKLHKNAESAVRDAFAAMRRQLQDFVRIRRGEVKSHG